MCTHHFSELLACRCHVIHLRERLDVGSHEMRGNALTCPRALISTMSSVPILTVTFASVYLKMVFEWNAHIDCRFVTENRQIIWYVLTSLASKGMKTVDSATRILQRSVWAGWKDSPLSNHG